MYPGGSDVKQWSKNDVEDFLTDANYHQYITLFQQQVCDLSNTTDNLLLHLYSYTHFVMGRSVDIF